MDRWKIIAIIATAFIVISFPAYVFKQQLNGRATTEPVTDAALFVGSQKCESCHKTQYDKWKGSHHDLAMDIATEETVLADFNDTTFTHFGIESRFFRKDERFFVSTTGPGGTMGTFEITHTFGYLPLQQYLVPFSGGRLQCLPIAWDVKQKKWFHLYPDAPVEPDDWLYWTNAGQNWNGMCAECHSTHLKKNFNPKTKTYKTTWSQIDVGCEACHGPGFHHVKWAELPEMGRPDVINFDLEVRTSNLTSREQIELCAPCHSRRMSLGDNKHTNRSFMDYGVPQLLSPGMYFSDGQILEEVYVYGSFLQSKMHARDVRCADCHDVHSAKRIKEGNALCLQCHQADHYDAKTHHFHKKSGEKGNPIRSNSGEVLFEVGTGALCEQCHMPGRDYMQIDYRPDHSFRIPRPDLTLAYSTPNACDRCHVDKSTQWSVDAVGKWYGQRYRPHYGSILAAGRREESEANKDLLKLAEGKLYPAIVRATAITLLASYDDSEDIPVIIQALSDEDPLVRHSAVTAIARLPVAERVQYLVPLLYDPVKAVRIEASRSLAGIQEKRLNPDQQQKFEFVLSEYRQAMTYTADFAASRHNLGNLDTDLGRLDDAIVNYQAATEIDGQFYPAKVNLAMLYNRQGKNDKAEMLFREVLAQQPELYDVQYSLGLLLAERQKYQEASLYLSAAARGLPNRDRISYNLGVLLDFLKKDLEAEAALKNALALSPEDAEYLAAMAQFYLKREKFRKAEPLAQRLYETHPYNPTGPKMLKFIQEKLSD